MRNKELKKVWNWRAKEAVEGIFQIELGILHHHIDATGKAPLGWLRI